MWDDVLATSGGDTLLLRRGTALWSLPIAGSAKPEKTTESPVLEGSSMVASVDTGGRLWTFFNSSRQSPFAIDARSGELVDFKIAELKFPENRQPLIQSHVLVRHADAVVLMIEGGDPDIWPRKHNHPMYFWMSLKSGKVVAFPVGWDLDYFSADQNVAVFGTTMDEVTFHRLKQAVDVKTGGPVADVPNRRKVAVVPFVWTDIQPVKALYSRRDGLGDIDFLSGLSVNGSIRLFDLELNGEHYMSTAEEGDGFVGFRVRRSGEGSGSSPFWIASMNPRQKPKLVATAVTDFVMFAGGNAVFSSAGDARRGHYSEVFFHNLKEDTRWNVLEGVERLPALEQRFAEKASVEDKMSVRLVGSLGDDSSGATNLCLFHHFRIDTDSFSNPPKEDLLERAVWRRTLLLTSSGQRYMTDLFRENDQPDEIWLHSAGNATVAKNVWISGERKFQLSRYSISVPE